MELVKQYRFKIEINFEKLLLFQVELIVDPANINFSRSL